MKKTEVLELFRGSLAIISLELEFRHDSINLDEIKGIIDRMKSNIKKFGMIIKHSKIDTNFDYVLDFYKNGNKRYSIDIKKEIKV